MITQNPLNTPEAYLSCSIPLKRVGSLTERLKASVTPRDLENQDVFHYSIPNIQAVGDGVWEEGTSIDSNKWLIQKPAVLISKLNPRKATVARVDPSGRRAVASPEFVVLTTNNENDDRYLEYVLGSAVVSTHLDSKTTSATNSHQRVQPSDILTLGIPWPNSAQRKQIADFLDRETAQIDAMIGAQESLVTRLEERRTAVTISLVESAGFTTRGQRLKHHLRSIRQGWSPQCHSYPRSDESEWAVLRAGCVNGGHFNANDNKLLPDELTPRPDTVVQQGELVISRANTRDLVGSAAAVEHEHPRLMLSDKLYALRFNDKVNPQFVATLLAGRQHRDLIELAATGASYSMLNISQSDIVNLPLDLPDLTTQDRSMVEVNRATGHMRNMITAASNVIALLRERREALITAAVTGRIDPHTGIEHTDPAEHNTFVNA